MSCGPVRPLSLFNRVFLESTVKSTINRYLDKSNTLEKTQHDFYKWKSINKPTGVFRGCQQPCGYQQSLSFPIFLDIQKAFDIVSCQSILRLLSHRQVLVRVNNWLTDNK